MKFGISNKINTIPIFINVIWTVIILYDFLVRVPEFEKQRPDGASYLIFGTIIITGFIFLASLIYVLSANLFMKIKIYFDLEYIFIPILFLLIMLFLNK